MKKPSKRTIDRALARLLANCPTVAQQRKRGDVARIARAMRKIKT